VTLRSRSRSLRADFLTIAHDIAPLWDFLTVSLAGYLSAVLYAAFGPLHAVHNVFHQDVGRIVLFGGLIAAIVMRPGRTPNFSSVTGSPTISPFVSAARRIVIVACLLLVLGFLTRVLDTVPRLWVLAWAGTTLVLAGGGRCAYAALLQAAVRRGVFTDKIAIVGSEADAERLISHIAQSQYGRGVQVVGVFADCDEDPWHSDAPLEQLYRLGQAGRIDRVILALPSNREQRIIEIVERLKALDIEASFFPALPGLKTLTARIGHVADATLIVLSPRPIRQWGLITKALLDGVIACGALLLLLPMLVAIALAIKLDSPGPVIFRQKRHGRNNIEFTIYKFRTMTHQPAAAPGLLQQTSRADARFTRVGRLLRKTSLDELPQLINVLNGTMSLVGPRPHALVMRTENLLGEEIVVEYPQRHRIKPGITGWAQVNGHRGATETVEQVRERVKYDIYYVENWSILFDLKILLVTPFAILFNRSNAF
jgi:Undecaprenyl-phosphate glucose phosphotransferase